MQVNNVTPAKLSPLYMPAITGTFDPVAHVQQLFARSVRTPIVASAPAVIKDDAGNDVSDADIAGRVAACCTDVVDRDSEDWCDGLFRQVLLHYTPGKLNVQGLFVNQAATEAGLAFPTATVIYTPATDVIPVSRKFIAGQATYEEYFATMAFYARSQTMAFYFVNNVAFDDFKAWLAAGTQPIAGTLPPETNQMLADFQKLRLNGLTESILLRNNTSENNDPGSFARLIMTMLLSYTAQVSPAEFGLMPFEVGELFCPMSMVFVNVEKHAHSNAKAIANEWDIINKSIKTPLNIVSNKRLMNLTAGMRALQKIQSAAANAVTNANQSMTRSKAVPFKVRMPSVIDIVRILQKVMSRMANVNRSENSYKAIRMTYNKPNRRDPDDFNKMGKSVSTKYRPDIHLYVDTSGSISEENYENMVHACMRMARKLNINLYFNSFSHYMSSCTKINVKDKSMMETYRAFQRIPKADGGTDYKQIWDYINASAKRRRELSLIITDFEWDPPSHFVEHPKNLYYLPCDRMNWSQLTYYAQRFCDNMRHIDPDMRRRLLF